MKRDMLALILLFLSLLLSIQFSMKWPRHLEFSVDVVSIEGPGVTGTHAMLPSGWVYDIAHKNYHPSLDIVPFDNVSNTFTYEMDPECAEKGILYLDMDKPWGQTSNWLRTFMNSVFIAESLNRTLVFEFRMVCKRYEQCEKMNYTKVFDLPYFVQENNYCLKPVLGSIHAVKRSYQNVTRIRSRKTLNDFSLIDPQIPLRITVKTAFDFCFGNLKTFEFLSSLLPSKEYALEVDSIMNRLGLEPFKFIGIHNRWYKDFEGKRWFTRESTARLKTMHLMELHTIYEILQNRSVSDMPIFAASDGKDPYHDQLLKNASISFVDFSEVDTSKFLPMMIDMFILMKSNLFLGGGYSTFSTLIADYRVSHSNQQMNVLSWPPLDGTTVEEYIQCQHAYFYCKPNGGQC